MKPQRRRPCTAGEARALCGNAVAYLETAELVRTDGARPEDFNFNHVAAGVAVLAAIAASDALCCTLLGERARGPDHRQAIALLATIRFGDGPPAARARQARELAAALATALDLKDEAHYGISLLTTSQLRHLIKAATKLVTAAVAVVRGDG